MPTLRLLIVESNFGRQKREWNSGRQSWGQKVKSLACTQGKILLFVKKKPTDIGKTYIFCA